MISYEEMSDRPGRDRIYRRYAETIAQMVASRQEHELDNPDCGAAPLCLGPAGMRGAELAGSLDPAFWQILALVAVGELSRASKEVDELAARLEVQRCLTAEMNGVADEMALRARVAEEAEQDLAGRLDDAEQRLSAALAELTIWEEAADHLGPTALPPTD